MGQQRVISATMPSACSWQSRTSHSPGKQSNGDACTSLHQSLTLGSPSNAGSCDGTRSDRGEQTLAPHLANDGLGSAFKGNGDAPAAGSASAFPLKISDHFTRHGAAGQCGGGADCSKDAVHARGDDAALRIIATASDQELSLRALMQDQLSDHPYSRSGHDAAHTTTVEMTAASTRSPQYQSSSSPSLNAPAHTQGTGASPTGIAIGCPPGLSMVDGRWVPSSATGADPPSASRQILDHPSPNCGHAADDASGWNQKHSATGKLGQQEGKSQVDDKLGAQCYSPPDTCADVTTAPTDGEERSLQEQLDESFVKGWNACLQAIEALNTQQVATALARQMTLADMNLGTLGLAALRSHAPDATLGSTCAQTLNIHPASITCPTSRMAPPGLLPSACQQLNSTVSSLEAAPKVGAATTGAGMPRNAHPAQPQSASNALDGSELADNNTMGGLGQATATESASCDASGPDGAATSRGQAILRMLQQPCAIDVCSQVVLPKMQHAREAEGSSMREGVDGETVVNACDGNADERQQRPRRCEPLLSEWPNVASMQHLTDNVHTPSEDLQSEVAARLIFHAPVHQMPGNGKVSSERPKVRYWKRPGEGQRADDWMRALPQLSSARPLPAIAELLSAAGPSGMELTQIARQMVEGDVRIDLLKLKAYLACFPSQIEVAPKTKTFADGSSKRVDQVWLTSASSQ